MRLALVVAATLALSVSAEAQDTDLELVLLADASGSIDSSEIAFQRQGYATAITDPEVLATIANTAYGSIAVTYVEWAANQAVVADLTIIDGPDSAAAFATELANKPRQAFGRNAIGSALLEGLRLMEDNDIDGWRGVIDFSGDSVNSYWDLRSRRPATRFLPPGPPSTRCRSCGPVIRAARTRGSKRPTRNASSAVPAASS